VEEPGEVRPDEASQAKVKTRPACGDANPQERCGRWRSTWRRARFEGEYPLQPWPGRSRVRGPTPRLCPLGVPKEAMAARGPDRRMVPALCARTHVLRSRRGCHRESPLREDRQSSVLAAGSDANHGRVDDREADRARCTSQLNAGKPRCISPLNPGKPLCSRRLGADASVEEGGVRMGEICLDTTFHRRLRYGTGG
jgi:hypothetical protein